MFLVDNFSESEFLASKAENELEIRLRGQQNYSSDEIERVSSLDSRLFPPNYSLSKEATRDLRALCSLSQCELMHPAKISSHRRIIGRPIVAAKRLLWRLISLHLKDTLSGLQEFCAWSVYSQAKLLARISEAEDLINELNTRK
jgi:hypothetical protein